MVRSGDSKCGNLLRAFESRAAIKAESPRTLRQQSARINAPSIFCCQLSSVPGSVTHGSITRILVRRVLGESLSRRRHVGHGLGRPPGTVQGGDDQSVHRRKWHYQRDRLRLRRRLATRAAGASRLRTMSGSTCRPTALARCAARFPGRRFISPDALRTAAPAELTLALDVIYHLIEDHVFAATMRTLFAWATRFVLIYASNLDAASPSPHVRHRRFTDHVAASEPDWRLLAHLPNPYPLRRGQSGRDLLRRFFHLWPEGRPLLDRGAGPDDRALLEPGGTLRRDPGLRYRYPSQQKGSRCAFRLCFLLSFPALSPLLRCRLRRPLPAHPPPTSQLMKCWRCARK